MKTKQNSGVFAAIRSAAAARPLLTAGTLLCVAASVGASLLPPLQLRKNIDKLTGIKPDEVRAILAQYDVEPRVAAKLTLIANDTRHGPQATSPKPRQVP